jgi:hypothetical protein
MEEKFNGGDTMLENFRKVDLTIGVSYMSITTNGVSFSKAAVVKMGAPSYVLLLINDDEKKIAIQECSKETEGANRFVRNENNLSVRWNNRELINDIEELMCWDLSQGGFRILGSYYRAENVMIFDLNTAEAIKTKKSK